MGSGISKVGVGIKWALTHPGAAIRLASAMARSDGGVVATLIPERGQRDAALSLMRATGVGQVTFTVDGGTWSTDIGDAVGAGLWRHGEFQGNDVRRAAAWLRSTGRTGCVVDVGANVGTSAVGFAREGFKVIAIEPVPATFDMLRRNAEANAPDLVHCLQVAVARQAGEVTMWTGFGSGQAEIAVDGVAPAMERWGSRGGRVVVVAAPLVELLAGTDVRPESVALVWADVQGSEAEVILTGGDLWSAGVPLYAEVDPTSLRIHGGLESFVDACTERFATFCPAAEIGQAMRPIAGLDEWVRAMGEREYSDALFVP